MIVVIFAEKLTINMSRISTKLLLVSFLISAIANVLAQNNCPAIPASSAFDPLTFIKTQTPTDPTKEDGIYLGQGTILRNGVETRPAFIPSNKPTWAIGIAVAWNYHRNMISSVKHPVIGYWLAASLQETELSCVTGLTWDDPAKTPKNIANAAIIEQNYGCLQIEHPGSAYGLLNQSYPLGRFAESRAESLVEGANNMETSALAIAYYDIYAKNVYHKQVGWNLYGAINCSADEYAFEKLTASAFNGGVNAFMNNESFLEESNQANANWQGLSATTPRHPSSVAQWVAVLENNTSYPDYPTGSTFDSYYNEDISWAMITDYLNIIAVMYSEIDFDKNITPKVQKAFENVAGSTSATIPFMSLGPVIDQIILSLPKESPVVVEGSPFFVQSNTCSGEKIPYGHFEIVNGTTDVCLGQSTTVKMMVDGGADLNSTFKWYKNSNPTEIVSTAQTLTISPDEVGTEIWIGEICNDNGCYQVGSGGTTTCLDNRAPIGITIKTSNCSDCSFNASSTVTNTTCSGMNDGTITLSLTESPSFYSVSYIGTSLFDTISGQFSGSGENFTIDGLIDGSYSIELIDNENPMCKAYTSAIIVANTELKESLSVVTGDIDNCEAPLSAEIKSLPNSCNYTVRAWDKLTYTWQNNMFLAVNTPTAGRSLDQYTKTIPREDWDGFNAAEIFERNYRLNTGDSLNFQFIMNSPFGTQAYPYHLEVLDENRETVYVTTVPEGATGYNAPYSAGYYIANCPVETPNSYNFNWSRNVAETATTETSFSGYALPAFNTDFTYTVSATNLTQPECIIKDSVVVLKDECGEVITLISREESVNKSDLFTVYPNPSSGNINLEASSGVNFKKIEVYSLLGKLVMSSSPENLLNEGTLNLEHLTKATYLIKVYTNSGSTSSQLFIKE